MALIVTAQPSTFGSKLVLDTAPTNTAAANTTSAAAAKTVLTFGSGIPSNGPLAITFGSLGTYTLTFDNTAGSSDATIGSDKAATIDPSVEVDSAGSAAKVLVLLRDGVTGDPLKDAYNFVYDGSSAGAETVTITAKSAGSTHDITVTESLSNLAAATTAGSNAGVFHMIEIDNSNYDTAVYLKIADATSGTVGTTAATLVFYCPANTKQSYISSRGITFGAGFTHWCVTGAAQANTDAPLIPPTIRYVVV
jgi:hypothetical protein